MSFVGISGHLIPIWRDMIAKSTLTYDDIELRRVPHSLEEPDIDANREGSLGV